MVSVEVEPTLEDEPELFIRDPVDEGGVVEALFDALGEKTTPAIDVVFWYDRRWSSVIREMIAKLMWMSSAARSSFVFPRVIVVDSVRASRTLLSLASFRTGLLPFFGREDLVTTVVLALADLPEELLCCVFGDPDCCSDCLY